MEQRTKTVRQWSDLIESMPDEDWTYDIYEKVDTACEGHTWKDTITVEFTAEEAEALDSYETTR